MRSESTRVPPVTALRSPPDSRITGADSPVTADSSTDAMPSITVPSPGISSPASTTTTSPRCELGGGLLAAVAQARDGLGAHRAQSGRLRLAAALGERLGQVGEHHRQPQPDRHGEGEPGGLVAAAERLAAEHLDEPAEGRDHRADLDDEHDRVADLDRAGRAWRSSRSAPAPASPRSSRLCARLLHQAASSSSARFSSSTFTPGSPSTPSARPSVFSSISSCTRSSGEPALFGHSPRLDARRWPRRCADPRPTPTS